MTNFVYKNYKEQHRIEMYIKYCKDQQHFQQVVYSVHGGCLTQICFDCQAVRSNYQKPEQEKLER